MSGENGHLPESGGLLDQDELLSKDLQTYGYLRAIAEGLLDRDARALEQGKKNLDRMSHLS